MTPIPVFAIINSITALSALTCAAVLFYRHKRSLWRNVLVYRFFFSFLFAGIFFVLNALPIVSQDAVNVQIFYNISEIFAMIAIIFFMSIPITIFAQKKIALTRIITYIISAFMCFFLVFTVATLKPAERIISGPFIEWKDSTNPTMLTAFWLITLFGFLFFLIPLIKEGWHNLNPRTKRRSRLIASGVIYIIIGLIANYIFMTMETQDISLPVAILEIASTLFAATGFILILLGVMTKVSDAEDNSN